ncbi:MAG: class I tRNA ligase family protein [Desulfobacterales bacterium]
MGRVEKMSKSKKNVIDPNTLLDAYGADTVSPLLPLCRTAGRVWNGVSKGWTVVSAF